MKDSSQAMSDTQVDLVARIIEAQLLKKEKNSGDGYIPSVFDIETRVYKTLIDLDSREVAESYEQYRVKQAQKRMQNLDNLIEELVSGTNEEWGKENSNKNARLVTTQRDYLAGAIGKDYVRRYVIPKDVLESHDKGAIHVHDCDYLAEETRTNCELINLEDMLQNGTVINGVMIEKPKRFITACTIATQIITGVTSATYGGATITLSHLVPFVDSSRRIHLKRYLDAGIESKKAYKLAERDTLKEINDGVQTFNYQILSMSSTNGQSPFISTFMYLGEVEEGQERDDLALIIEEMLKQRIIGLKNAHGAYIAPAFPKLILCLDRVLMDKNSKYHYLINLAAECTAKRLVPDYISEKKMLELKINQWGDGDVYPKMGCRSFLTPDRVQGNIAKAQNYVEGKGKYYGRFNIGVTTLNLPYIALESKANGVDFFETLDHYAELAHKMQRVRAERLMQTQANVAPILWCYGALARLEPTDTLESLIKGGYATSSLGYSGLYEAVKVLTGENHYEAGIGHEMGKKIMHFLNDKTAAWTKKEDIDYSLYGTPKFLGD